MILTSRGLRRVVALALAAMTLSASLRLLDGECMANDSDHVVSHSLTAQESGGDHCFCLCGCGCAGGAVTVLQAIVLVGGITALELAPPGSPIHETTSVAVTPPKRPPRS